MNRMRQPVARTIAAFDSFVSPLIVGISYLARLPDWTSKRMVTWCVSGSSIVVTPTSASYRPLSWSNWRMFRLAVPSASGSNGVPRFKLVSLRITPRLGGSEIFPRAPTCPLNRRPRHHAVEMGGERRRQGHLHPLGAPELGIEQRGVGDGERADQVVLAAQRLVSRPVIATMAMTRLQD